MDRWKSSGGKMWEESENILKSQCEKHTTIFWKLRCRKNVRAVVAGDTLSKRGKTLHVGSTFGRSTAPHKTTTTTLHYIPLHPAVVGEVTTATTPKSTTPTYSNHLSVHQQIRSPHPCITKIHPSYGFLSSKLPPPPCIYIYMYVCMCVCACV